MALGIPGASVTGTLAALAFGITIVKCLVFAAQSDIGSLPRIGRLSRRASRIVYRLTIAALHVLHPFARLHGRIRGWICRPPGQAGPRRRLRVRPASPRAAVAGLGRGLRLLFGRSVQTAYWSERWVDREALLYGIGDRLRGERAARQVEIDSGWWENRDLTVGDRAWFRVHLRALLEDHGGGRSLCRLGIGTRLTAVAAVPVLAGTGAVLLLDRMGLASLPLGAAIVACAGVAIAVWDVMVVSDVVAAAAARVAAELGLVAIESPKTRRSLPQDSPAVSRASSEP
jgi:hypothetical protein